MSDDKEQNAEYIGTSGIYGQLLDTATKAKGSEKMDPSIGQMKEEDKKWLENVLTEMACKSDPTKKLKNLIAQLINFEHKTDDDLAFLSDVVDGLIDLICQVDFALDFVKLNGLKTIENLMENDNAVNERIIGIISEVAQNNEPVQKLIVKTDLLERLLSMLKERKGSPTVQLRVVGAISSIVKGHPPSIIKLVNLDGPNILMSRFYDAIKEEDEKLVHRCVVVIVNIGASCAPELIRALKVNVDKYMEDIGDALSPHGNKYSEALNYLNQA